MSTFDGTVNEFPNIRIDYFRRHLEKTPPQACFLSHIHSDHLQGLETLKMPFVYCSTATKRILLRMEKYPHRINFAKGILEARKQTYKSLSLVLKPLPLETPVDLELDPKTKIRVTLFDANHCPGAVMFLIEGSGKAILYTGDIRAEPWWVNSIVRNPMLLPYACGAKTLDCIYLDTTFASRNDIYESFPTKAEGLKELLTKVSKCSDASTLYFRSWTLGYEDVWITLSKFLRSPIHVDDYQLRLFKSLVDDTSSTDRGPALSGFVFGNHYQPGCLTDDSTATIHSCEPGTECHDRIKKREDVIWITPIVSRLRDGTEIPEVGAGGGAGDLYQIPLLECIDDIALKALEELFANDAKHKTALSSLGAALSTARSKGESSVSLEGLGLDLDEEVSLKRFMHLMSNKDKQTDPDTNKSGHKTIHFPYSRHSSFSELRHLVSSFKPRDICPCTVDLDTWSDEISIRSLFGDLCSDDTFKHDQTTRLAAEQRQEMNPLKRKRIESEDSQQIQTQTQIQSQPQLQSHSLSLSLSLSQFSNNTDEVYKSAKTSIRKDTTEDECQPPPQQVQPEPKHQSMNPSSPTSKVVVPPSVQRFHDLLHHQLSNQRKPQPLLNNEIDVVNTRTRNLPPTNSLQHSSEQSSPGSAHDPDIDMDIDEDDTTSSPTPSPSTFDLQSEHPVVSPVRLSARRNAYLAAKAVLEKNEHDEWNGLRLRSLGWKGHTEEEGML